MLTIKVNVHGEDIPFDAVLIDITQEGVRRLAELAIAVAFLKAYKIVEFDPRVAPYSIEWAPEGQPLGLLEMDVRLECVCVNVTSTYAFWSGYVKHTYQRWETAPIDIRTLLDADDDTVIDQLET